MKVKIKNEEIDFLVHNYKTNISLNIREIGILADLLHCEILEGESDKEHEIVLKSLFTRLKDNYNDDIYNTYLENN
jgi:hypothetical protein